VENFGHLLGSRRVGARAIARALPEMHAGCGALRAAIDGLTTEIVVMLGADAEGVAAVRALLAHASARVGELDAELLPLIDKVIETRQRLRLETVVRRIAADLDAMVRVTDLFGAVAARRSTSLDLTDVLSERRQPAGVPAVRASVRIDKTAGLVGDARIVVELIEFAVATVARAGVASPEVVAAEEADGRVVIEVGPPGEGAGGAAATAAAKPADARPAAKGARAERGGAKAAPAGTTPERFIEVPIRSELPRAADVIQTAARRAGITIDIAPGSRRVTVVL
jgi:hypothetical protein